MALWLHTFFVFETTIILMFIAILVVRVKSRCSKKDMNLNKNLLLLDKDSKMKCLLQFIKHPSEVHQTTIFVHK